MAINVRFTNRGAFLAGLQRIRNKEARVDTIISEELDDLVIRSRNDAPEDTGQLKNSIRRNGSGVIVGAAYGAPVELGTRYKPPQPFFITNTTITTNRIDERIRDEARKL